MELRTDWKDYQDAKDYNASVKKAIVATRRELKKHQITFEFDKLKKPTTEIELLSNNHSYNIILTKLNIKLNSVKKEEKEEQQKKIFISTNKKYRKNRSDGHPIKAISKNGTVKFPSHGVAARELNIPEASFNHMLRRKNSINCTGYDFVLKSGKVVKSYNKING